MPSINSNSTTSDLEIIFLGTGTSSAVPSIGCLVSKDKGCFCCRSTLNLEDLDSRKNIRRNTSAILRIPSTEEERERGEDRVKSLLIDCGKTFYSGAVEHWPKHNLKEIDGILITHPHSDAILGLDDLRGWTLHQHIQKSIDIYVNQSTYDEISKAFPYLCDSKKATGGGDVPALQWHIIDDSKPFTILGVRIVPLPVHHGKFFTTPPTPYYCLGYLFDSKIVYLSDVSFIPESVWDLLESECELPEQWRPTKVVSNGTVNGNAKEVVSKSTPPSTPPLTPSSLNTLDNPLQHLSLTSSSSTSPHTMNGHSNGQSHSHSNGNGITKKPKLQVLIIDCLRIESHTSHFGIGQAIESSRRMGPLRTYLVGFGHATSHSSWTHALESFSSSIPTTLSIPHNAPRFIKPENQWELFEGTSIPGVEDKEVFKESLLRAVECWEGFEERERKNVAGGGDGEVEKKRNGFWVRAACDGLRITLGGEGGGVRDDVYDV